MAQKIFSSYAETLDRFPVALPEMTNGLMLLNQSPTQIIISGVEDDAKSKTLIEAVYGMLLPHKILLRASEKEKSNLIYQNVEMLQNIPTGSTFLCYCHVKSKSLFSTFFFFSDKPRAYLCKNFACSAPVETPEELANLIEQE